MRKPHTEILGLVIIGLSMCATAYGQTTPIENGLFANGLTDWTSDGDVTVIDNMCDPYGTDNMILLDENDTGGISRIYQEFDLTDSPEILSFEYRLYQFGGPRNTELPPDSLIVFLVDPTTGDRLVVPLTTNPPVFTNGIVYVDNEETDGIYDSSKVTVTEPGDKGLYTATVDISSLSEYQSVRLEFGLASCDNNVTSWAVVDNVHYNCIADSVYCCNPTTGVLTPIDDNNQCTTDECNTVDGTVTNTRIDGEAGCCGECSSSSVDIVIMIDITKSTTDYDDEGETLDPNDYSMCTTGECKCKLHYEKMAALALLEMFENATTQPRIAVGTFSVSSGSNIMTNCGLNTDYTNHKAAIKALTNTDGYTDLHAAIDAAQEEFMSSGDRNGDVARDRNGDVASFLGSERY